MAKLLENPMRLSRAIALAALVLALVTAMYSQSTAPGSNAPAPNTPGSTPASTPADGAKKSSETSQEPKQGAADPKAELAAPVSPEAAREAQIEEDTKTLFRLCAEMRAEVAKTYKETLSLTVLKKAEDIEKLAKSLKALMEREASTAKSENPKSEDN